jgi:hypothetical protein
MPGLNRMIHRPIDLVTSGSRSHHGEAFVLVGSADFHRHCITTTTLALYVSFRLRKVTQEYVPEQGLISAYKALLT